MALHPQGARRIATGAALAAVLGTVLVGIGMGVGTAEVPAAVPVAAARPVPALPDAPTRAPVRAPEAAPADDGDSEDADPEDVAPTATPDYPTPDADVDADQAAVPTTVPARAAAPPAPATVEGTPCTATAKACVDLGSREAWLLEDGAVRRGPVSVQIGDEIDPTPLGTFAVEWKAEQWTSREFLTQMPYSVFFAEGGIAFHEGAQDSNSAGCVKLVHADAVAFFEYLQVGDEVQIR